MTIIHCKTASVTWCLCELGAAYSLSNFELTRIDSWIKLLETAVGKLPGVFERPECIPSNDLVIGCVGTSAGYGFPADDDFRADGKTPWIKLGVEFL